MNIEFIGEKVVCFEDLKIGDIFRLSNTNYPEQIFMKIEKLEIAKKAISTIGFPIVNAVYLPDGNGIGTTVYFSDNVIVEKFEIAKLVLK